MIELKNIGFAYDKNAAPVLRDVSFSLADGQCASVLGNNGAGKSTLLKCIDRILDLGGEVKNGAKKVKKIYIDEI